jgi:hypothetical protein
MDRRDLHPWLLRVDTEFRVAIDFIRRVQPLGRGTDQGEILRILQHQAVRRRHRQGRRGIPQLPIAQLAGPGRDHALLRPADGRVDAPLLGRGCDQQRAGDRARLAQRRPEGANRRRHAGQLAVEDRVGVERIVGRGMLQLDLIEADFQLLRQQHGERRIGALPHLDHRHHQRDCALAVDADEGVGRKRRGLDLRLRDYARSVCVLLKALGDRRNTEDHK